MIIIDNEKIQNLLIVIFSFLFCLSLFFFVSLSYTKRESVFFCWLASLSYVRNKKGKKITVEVDNLKQLKLIVGIKFNTVLFDNMNIKNLKLGIKLAKKYYETEASGNITLKNVYAVARTGVDRISVGSITHSAPAIDFKLEV